MSGQKRDGTLFSFFNKKMKNDNTEPDNSNVTQKVSASCSLSFLS